MRDIRKILVPTDFSSCAERALEHAAWFARRIGASIEILHVWHPSPWVGPELTLMPSDSDAATPADLSRDAARAAMERLAVSAALDGVTVTTRIESNDIQRAILAAADGVDLIVMGTHGRRGLARVLLGSVTENIVRQSPVPVLTVSRPPQPAAAGK